MRYRNGNLIDCISLLTKENKELLETLNECMKVSNKYYELYGNIVRDIKTIQSLIFNSSISNSYKEEIDSIIVSCLDKMKDVL